MENKNHKRITNKRKKKSKADHDAAIKKAKAKLDAPAQEARPIHAAARRQFIRKQRNLQDVIDANAASRLLEPPPGTFKLNLYLFYFLTTYYTNHFQSSS